MQPEKSHGTIHSTPTLAESEACGAPPAAGKRSQRSRRSPARRWPVKLPFCRLSSVVWPERAAPNPPASMASGRSSPL